MNNLLRIIAVAKGKDGTTTDGREYSFMTVTMQDKPKDNVFRVRVPVKKNYFHDNKLDAEMYKLASDHLEKHAANANTAEALKELPDISGEIRSEKYPDGFCHFVKDSKTGAIIVHKDGADKGKQRLGNTFTTIIVDGGESYEDQRNRKMQQLVSQGLVAKMEDLSSYEDPKARQLYAEMLIHAKELEQLESQELPS